MPVLQWHAPASSAFSSAFRQAVPLCLVAAVPQALVPVAFARHPRPPLKAARSKRRSSNDHTRENLWVWFNTNLKSYAADIASHGADCGFPWITYTQDTVTSTRFVAEMIAGFRRSDMLGDAGELLLRAMDKFRFADAWGQIADGRDKIFPGTANKVMTEKIRRFLTRKLGTPSTKAAA
jgi:hypothetical protein